MRKQKPEDERRNPMNEETGNKTPGAGTGKSSAPAPDAEAVSGVKNEEGKKTILAVLASAFGFGKSKAEKSAGDKSEDSTRLARKRTDFAMDRSYLATERTLMAWIRTALSMISFGFTIGKLGQVLNDLEIKGIGGKIHTVSVETIAHFLVVLGTVALLGAAFQHRRRVRELYAMGLHYQISITFYVALLLAVVGVFALTALVMAL